MVHFNTEARTGHPMVKEVLKLIKAGHHVPELIFNPFTLKLCLSLTSLKQYRQPLVEGLKGAIGRIMICAQKKHANAWFAEEIQDLPDCKALIQDVIKTTCTYGSWELIGDGIVDLALLLLDIKAGMEILIIFKRCCTVVMIFVCEQ